MKMKDNNIQIGVNKFWETTVYHTKFTDLKLRDELTEDILNNIDLYSNNSVEMQDNSIFNIKRKIINRFKKELVLPVFHEYLKILEVDVSNYEIFVKGWLTDQKTRYSLNYHNHKGASISAVFYPFIGEKNNSSGGEIVFYDPRSNANRGYVNNFSKLFEPKVFFPSTGDILIFPSFLYHNVNTYFSTMRLAIAVDYFTNRD